MKKLYLLVIIFAFSQSSIAQQTKGSNSSQNSFYKKGGIVSEWYSPEAFIRNNRTGPFTDYTRIIFPDSTVVSINQDDEKSNISFHAWGHLFDLMHVGWGGIPNDVFAQRDNYTWDSLAFGYIYRRNNSDINIIDTCFITYYKSSILGQIKNKVVSFGNSDSIQYSVPTGLNQNTLAGVFLSATLFY